MCRCRRRRHQGNYETKSDYDHDRAVAAVHLRPAADFLPGADDRSGDGNDVRQADAAGDGTRAYTCKWPWPIQQVYKFDKRIHNFESKFEQVFTADGHSLMIKIYAGWNITQPQVFFPKFGDSVTRLEDALSGLARSAYSGVVGTHSFSDFISTDEKQLKFGQIEQEILAADPERRAGQRLRRGGKVHWHQADRFARERDEAGVRTDAGGAAIASASGSKRKGGGRRAIFGRRRTSRARKCWRKPKRSHAVRGEGDKLAAASLQVLDQEPELGKFLIQLRALEDFLKDRTTLILDTQTSPLNLLNGSPSSSTMTAVGAEDFIECAGMTNGLAVGSSPLQGALTNEQRD